MIFKISRKRTIRTLLWIVLLVVGTLFIPSKWLLAGLTVHTPLTNSDAIVLLAGAHKERVPAAAMLYRDGYAPLVILTNDGVFSGWSTKYNRNLYQVEWAEEDLVTLGVPRDRIVKLPFYGSATIFDALAVKKYLFKNGQKKIIVVTSEYHTRRAFWVFEDLLKVLPKDVIVFPAKSLRVSSKDLLIEYMKFFYYHFRYGLLGMVPQADEVLIYVR